MSDGTLHDKLLDRLDDYEKRIKALENVNACSLARCVCCVKGSQCGRFDGARYCTRRFGHEGGHYTCGEGFWESEGA